MSIGRHIEARTISSAIHESLRVKIRIIFLLRFTLSGLNPSQVSIRSRKRMLHSIQLGVFVGSGDNLELCVSIVTFLRLENVNVFRFYSQPFHI